MCFSHTYARTYKRTHAQMSIIYVYSTNHRLETHAAFAAYHDYFYHLCARSTSHIALCVFRFKAIGLYVYIYANVGAVFFLLCCLCLLSTTCSCFAASFSSNPFNVVRVLLLVQSFQFPSFCLFFFRCFFLHSSLFLGLIEIWMLLLRLFSYSFIRCYLFYIIFWGFSSWFASVFCVVFCFSITCGISWHSLVFHHPPPFSLSLFIVSSCLQRTFYDSAIFVSRIKRLYWKESMCLYS